MRAISKIWWGIVFPRLPASWKLPAWYHYYKFKNVLEPEMEMLKYVVPSDRTSIDIGANIGLYCYRLVKLCPRVEAFEPNPQPVAILRGYGSKKICIHNVALSSASGETELHIPFASGQEMSGLASLHLKAQDGEHHTIAVNRQTLDDIGFDNVGFVKIDVEGHEAEVIEGAKKTLHRCKPVLLIEIEQRHIDVPIEQIFSQVESLGYLGYFLLNNMLNPRSAFSVETHQAGAQANSEQSPRYVNNFFFFPDNASGLMQKLKQLQLIV